MTKVFDTERFRYVIVTVPIFFMIGMVLSFPLWLNDRNFPTAPIFPFLSSLPDQLTLGCSVFLFIALLFLSIKPSYLLKTITLILCLLLFAFDQNRMQPWSYFYFLMIVVAPAGNHKKINPGVTVNMCELIMIGVYLWSGIHKFNNSFLHQVFSGILTNIFQISDTVVINRLLPFGYVIPGIEVITAAGLYFTKTRKAALFIAIAFHILILIFLLTSPVHNIIVIPWNIAMILLVIILFHRNNNPVVLFAGKRLQEKISAALIFLLIIVMPATNFAGLWDSYLSFNLYSGKTKELFIAVSEDQLAKLDDHYEEYFLKMPSNLLGGKVISANKWAMDRLGVPVYPERRVFNSIARSFCSNKIPDGELIFLVSEGPISNNSFERFTCSDIK